MDELKAVICWIGVTLTPWPKAVVASSTGPTLSSENKIPELSPFRSTPVFLPKPNLFIYSNSLSFPILCPKVTKPGLQEFSTTWRKVWCPWPPAFQHLILAFSTWMLPPSSKVSLSRSTNCSCNAVAKVIILKLTPENDT